jgi:hypothetical protein
MAEHPADKIFALSGLLSSEVCSLVWMFESYIWMQPFTVSYKITVLICYQLVSLTTITFRIFLLGRQIGASTTGNPLPPRLCQGSTSYDQSFHSSSASARGVQRNGSLLILRGCIIDELRVVASPLTMTQQRQFNRENTLMQVFNSPATYRPFWLAFRERAVHTRLEAGWRILFGKHRKRTLFSQGTPEDAYWLVITPLDSGRLWESFKLVANEPHVARTYASYEFLTTPMRICARMGLGLTT